MTDDLTIDVRGRRISGWTDIDVALKADGFPPQFTIGATWTDPTTRAAVIAAAGDECQIYLGNDLVISGYIDQDIGGGSARGHGLSLTGRGKSQDLVDCAAEWQGGQMINGDALTISRNLAARYGVPVVLGEGASPGPIVPSWALNYGETPAEIMQRLAQNAGLIAYEDHKGRVILAQVGNTRAASGVKYGENVEQWSVTHSMHERYSDVVCSFLSMDAFGDLNGSEFFHVERDPNVPRHRQIYVVVEGVAEDGEEFAIRKAKWEVARRAGRSTVVTATIDSWRDQAGALWQPNTLVPVDVPGNRLPSADMILSEVRFRRSNEGTHADLVLMPREAFTIEPISLLPINTADLTELPSSP